MFVVYGIAVGGLCLVVGIATATAESETAGCDCWWTGPRCIRSCYNRVDGDYQSCDGCHVYATCTNGIFINDRPCAPATPPLNWDDNLKICNYNSTTCKCYRKNIEENQIIPTKSSEISSVSKKSDNAAIPDCKSTGKCCITNCKGLKNGDYQSCHSCHVYATCSNGLLVDDRQCPASDPPLKWDDRVKRCLYKSKTCRCFKEEQDYISRPRSTMDPVAKLTYDCTWTGSDCIRDCTGRPDGDYQSCHGCSVYASCYQGQFYDDRQCDPANPPLQWDDNAKQCLYASSTCQCFNSPSEYQNHYWNSLAMKFRSAKQASDIYIYMKRVRKPLADGRRMKL